MLMKTTRKPKKILVYLDQNVLSDTAKLEMNARVRADFRVLFQLLHQAFLDGKLTTLRSTNHDAETSIAGSLKDNIRERFATLSHVRLKHPLRIKEAQISRAVQLWLGHANATSVINFDDAFDDDPDGPVPMFDIDVDRDWMFCNEVKDRNIIASELDAVRAREKANGSTFQQLYKRELDWVRGDLASRFKAPRLAAIAGITIDEFCAFTKSAEFGDIPSIHLDVALVAKLMTIDPHRNIKSGDVSDLDAIAYYLPYCDAFITDKFAANVALAIDVDKQYDCALFNASQAGVAGLIDFLKMRLSQ
jgi:hypothetical protein